MLVCVLSISCFILFCLCLYLFFYSRKKFHRFEDDKTRLEKKLDKKTHDLTSMQEAVIEGMATVIEYRDLNTGMHVQNTKKYVMLIAQYLYDHGLYKDVVNRRFLSLIGNAAAMHDLGKISVSDRILNKPARLSEDEFEAMKTHTIIGAGLVRQVFGNSIDKDMLQMCIDVVQYHHEKWNGSGYPIGLKGNDIPLAARIMAIADVFDAIVSRRIYKDSVPANEVFEIIKKDAGVHFDPVLADIFISLKDEILEYIKDNSEQMNSSKTAINSDDDDRVQKIQSFEDIEDVLDVEELLEADELPEVEDV